MEEFSTEYENCIDMLEEQEEVTLEEFAEIESKDEYKEWNTLWKGMSGVIKKNEGKFKHIVVHFMTKEDMEDFSKLMGHKITKRTKMFWYPPKEECTSSLDEFLS